MKVKLPNKLIVLKNPDKKFHEAWNDSRNMLNIPHPFRCLALGPPNSGKTNVVENLLLRENPPFEEVVVIHCDGEYTKEYDDVSDELEILSEIPAPEDWEGKVKTLVVLDELEYKNMNKDQKRNLDRLFGYVSTHKNISIILCSQDFHETPAIVRRCSNLFILWKSPDLNNMAMCARKTGISAEGFRNLFKLCSDTKDSIWIDLTDKSPYHLRKNGYTIINKKDDTKVEID